jgi:hypothetical protein
VVITVATIIIVIATIASTIMSVVAVAATVATLTTTSTTAGGCTGEGSMSRMTLRLVGSGVGEVGEGRCKPDRCRGGSSKAQQSAGSIIGTLGEGDTDRISGDDEDLQRRRGPDQG